jgi:hypothetical protein
MGQRPQTIPKNSGEKLITVIGASDTVVAAKIEMPIVPG